MTISVKTTWKIVSYWVWLKDWTWCLQLIVSLLMLGSTNSCRLSHSFYLHISREVSTLMLRLLFTVATIWGKRRTFIKILTWLILPVVIRLSQRLSHACLSINNFVLWNCEWLIISVIVYSTVPYYLDNRSNSRANTCINTQLLVGRVAFIRLKPIHFGDFVLNHNNCADRSKR